ncbi:hypothetical protein GE21DRAFT_8939 [Neurospora crassa]|uniref:Uncharacterized protein n=1 Tax=Neurospora crassa (strain ATCC 24698 / 74-OR23-1A / CBS 708.71 / DSM 1257 / FGSC 987) TaxID=367110 RepID=Q7S6Y4_NEUCR|nr:hypothetical protein NCU05579 [Neurospora crassa OR74A]EAA31305.1 hypothetical protein NCU05579 [Neurospora crassa OR74A]KHE86730.1 hypothetical protein GE21DRAFT_8939 [Neurospora crassa]|eukprot:XP_960541.1 hypothetical protein NCU05579 [Neurospora crassa OR74A]
MAPPNEAGTPANPGGTRRAPYNVMKPVVPALPLGFPQRPNSTIKQAKSLAPAIIARSQPVASAVQRAVDPDLRDRQQGQPSAEAAKNEEKHNGAPLLASQPAQHNGANVNAPPTEPMHHQGKTDVPTGRPIQFEPAPPSSNTSLPRSSHHAPSQSTASSSIYTHEAPTAMPQPTIIYRPQAAFHQGHPSNAGLYFGGPNDSGASSPASHPMAPFPPPGGLPYAPGTIPPFDGYGRPLLISSTVDGYPAALVNHHGPPTPHSVHGSQSPIHPGDHNFGQLGSANGQSANGQNGHSANWVNQSALPPQGLSPPVNGLPQPNASVMAFQREQNAILDLLRNAANNHLFSDCTLQVQFKPSHQFQEIPGHEKLYEPLAIPAHRLVLARSPTLVRIMELQGTGPGGVVSLELDNEYVRSDTLLFAIRSLYGWTLRGYLPAQFPPRGVVEDFKLALSYITTGRYLQLPQVVSFAVHRGAELVCWPTIELATEFVLKSVIFSSQQEGVPIMTELIDSVLHFIAHNIPQDFVLDTSVSDFGFPRLPAETRQAAAPPSAAPRDPQSSSNEPVPATQAPSRLSKGSINPRLLQIRFGDLSLGAENGQGSTKQAESPRSNRAPALNDTILSRILLNLPFDMFKIVMENSPNMHHNIVNEVVQEREARRTSALAKNIDVLGAFARPALVNGMPDYWYNNMGFKEEVFSGDGAYLVRTWIHGEEASP